MTTFAVKGGHGIGVNPEGTDFPFLNPSEDIQGLLADAFVSHEVHTVALPLRIDWLFGFDKAFGETATVAVAPGLDGSVVPDPHINVAANTGFINPASVVEAVVPTPLVSSGYPAAVHHVDLRIIDANNVIIFDSTRATYYTANDFGTRLRVHEWHTTSAVCRVAQHTAFEDADSAKIFPEIITPVNAVLDERASQLLPQRVNTISVAAVSSTGPVRFRGGYNVNLFSGIDPRPNPQLPNVTPLALPGVSDTPEVGGRVRNRITISADPGDGDGRFKKCLEEDLPIRSINGVEPDTYGNFNLTASQCYWLRRPSALINGGATFSLTDNEVPVGGPSGEGSLTTASTLQLGNDCTPCCECEDYIRTYKGVTRVHKEFSDIGTTATEVRDKYKDAISRWESQKSCRAANPSRVAMAATPSADNLLLDVAASFCNSSDECVTATTALNFTLSCGAGGGGTAPTPGNPDNCNVSVTTSGNAQSQAHELAGSWPNYTVSWGSVDPGRSVNVKARFVFKCDDIEDCVVTACATTTADGTAGSPVCASLAMNCEGCA